MSEAPKLVMLTAAERRIIAAMIRESQPIAKRYLAEVAPLYPIDVRMSMIESARVADALLEKIK